MKKTVKIKTFSLVMSGAMLFSLVMIPTTVKAVEETIEPIYYQGGVGHQKYINGVLNYDGEFFANGIPITISATNEEGYSALISWDGGSQLIENNDMIFGGSDSTTSNVNLGSTSITMNGGDVRYITAGNKTTNEAKCSESKIGTAIVDINGGVVDGVFGTDNQNSAFSDKVANSGTELYKNYAIDSLKVTIDGATVKDFRGVTSYTYANKMDVTVGKDEEANLLLQIWGTNGFINDATFTMYSGKTDVGRSNYRAAINKMTYNILGGEIGDIYAGSFYDDLETSASWGSVGTVDYGFANDIEINIAKDVVYNDIIAGFQFRADEVAAFKAKYGETAQWRINGLNEKASLVLNLATMPSATVLNDNTVIDSKIAKTNWVTTNITLNETNKTLAIGQSFVLNATVLPEKAPGVTYVSADETIASVDEEGRVNAIKAGTTTITVTSGDITAECFVKVEEVKVDIPSIDTSKPVNKVTTIVPEETGKLLSKEASLIVSDILTGKETTQIDEQTIAKVKKALDKGLNIESVVSITNIEETTLDKETVKIIKNILTKDAIVAQYLDINVALKAQNDILGTINTFTNKLNFTIMIPQNLIVEERAFYVVRLHDGKADKLETILNVDGTLTFATDKLSTYALVYEDKNVDNDDNITVPDDKEPTTPDKNPDITITPDDPNTTVTPNEQVATNKTVDTGDKMMASLYSAMMLSAVVVIGLIWAVNERKKLMHK